MSSHPPHLVAEVHHVHKAYGPVRAVTGVDFSLARGEVVALLGPNGAGKTTTMQLLLGLLRPDQGHVRLLGGDPRDPATRLRLGAMLQNTTLPMGVRVEEYLELFSSYYPAPLPIAETLAVAQLEPLRRRRFVELSAGERQRLRFALALCGDPAFLLLDEPTANLDAVARRHLWGHLRERAARGLTLLFATHDLEEADALADRVILLHQGRVLRDATPRAIKASLASQHASCETRLAPADLVGVPGITRVERVGGRLEIRASGTVALARELYRRDPELTNLLVKQASLEDAFLHLTAGDGARP